MRAVIHKLVSSLILALATTLLLGGCQEHPAAQKRAVLRIVTLPLLTSYTPIQTLDDQGNPTQLISGFDHDIVSQFAESLDRDPVFIVASS